MRMVYFLISVWVLSLNGIVQAGESIDSLQSLSNDSQFQQYLILGARNGGGGDRGGGDRGGGNEGDRGGNNGGGDRGRGRD